MDYVCFPASCFFRSSCGEYVFNVKCIQICSISYQVWICEIIFRFAEKRVSNNLQFFNLDECTLFSFSIYCVVFCSAQFCWMGSRRTCYERKDKCSFDFTQSLNIELRNTGSFDVEKPVDFSLWKGLYLTLGWWIFHRRADWTCWCHFVVMLLNLPKKLFGCGDWRLRAKSCVLEKRKP